MAILIKRMEMPEDCVECPLMTIDYGCVIIGPVGGALSENRRSEWCPLTEEEEVDNG